MKEFAFQGDVVEYFDPELAKFALPFVGSVLPRPNIGDVMAEMGFPRFLWLDVSEEPVKEKEAL